MSDGQSKILTSFGHAFLKTARTIVLKLVIHSPLKVVWRCATHAESGSVRLRTLKMDCLAELLMNWSNIVL